MFGIGSTPTTLGIFVAMTSLGLLGALAGWYHSLNRYEGEMSRRAFRVMKYAFPPFMFLSASPLFDVVAFYFTGRFPTIGAPGMAVGLVGAAVTLGFVLVDVQDATEESAGAPDARGE